MTQSFCDANSQAFVHITRKDGENCMLDFAPDSYLEHKTDYYQDKHAGVYIHNGAKYISKTAFIKSCDIKDDIVAHPILRFFAQVLGAVFSILVFCLFLTCC